MQGIEPVQGSMGVEAAQHHVVRTQHLEELCPYEEIPSGLQCGHCRNSGGTHRNPRNNHILNRDQYKYRPVLVFIHSHTHQDPSITYHVLHLYTKKGAFKLFQCRSVLYLYFIDNSSVKDSFTTHTKSTECEEYSKYLNEKLK